MLTYRQYFLAKGVQRVYIDMKPMARVITEMHHKHVMFLR